MSEQKNGIDTEYEHDLETAPAEATFYNRKDGKVCFHVNDIHVAVFTQREAMMVIKAMKRDAEWSKTEEGTA